jgi:hypothetical protein
MSGNQGARARLVLVDLLRDCGISVSLVEVHGWTRHEQGEAYLWAIDYKFGKENLPMPPVLYEKHRPRCLA